MALKKQILQIFYVIAGSAIIVLGIAWWIEWRDTSVAALVDDPESLEEPLTPDALPVAEDKTSLMNPIATILTNKGTITLELFESEMPITVGNFVKLAREGYYDDTKFHRVIDGFMIQGGDPNTKSDNVASYGMGGPGYTIQDEFVEGPLLTNVRGTISMANTGQPNSGGSQFFINTVDNIGLDYNKEPLTSKHPVFGRVIDGMDVVDLISKVETIKPQNLPVEPVIIESVTISGGAE
jgi:peptidylprolyl isomerase